VRQHLGDTEAAVGGFRDLIFHVDVNVKSRLTEFDQLLHLFDWVSLELDDFEAVVQVVRKLHQRLSSIVNAENNDLAVLALLIGQNFHQVGNGLL
jgi:hypothetical protein